MDKKTLTEKLSINLCFYDLQLIGLLVWVSGRMHNIVILLQHKFIRKYDVVL